jgi:hypothetical protein
MYMERCNETLLTLEEGTDTLCRNVGEGLPFDAALYHRRTQVSHTIYSKWLDDQNTTQRLLTDSFMNSVNHDILHFPCTHASCQSLLRIFL